jgi:hypothetical protein
MPWRPTLLQSLTVLLLAVAAIGGPTVPTPAPAAYPEVAGWLAEPGGPPDPVRADPATVAAFFATLRAPAAADLTRRYPRIVGALDGAPPALRYAANGPDRLLYDPRADGRIALVTGDLTSADRVAILVPGVNTTVANFVTGLGGVSRRAPAWQAAQLAAEVHRRWPDARTAVIAWLGYDPPDGIGRAALREDAAAAGAVALRRFVAGLVAVRPGVRITVIGHSYGSVVAALAAPRLDPAVTDLVALGSPGMGGAESVGDLHTTARVWAGSAPDDWTRRIPGLRLLGIGHGRLPVSPGFGALPLPAGDVSGHDGYFVPGTSSLRALAEVAAGHAGETDPR